MAKFTPEIATNVSPTSAGPAPSRAEVADYSGIVSSVGAVVLEERKDFLTGEFEKKVTHQIERYQNEYLDPVDPDEIDDDTDLLIEKGGETISQADSEMQSVRSAWIQGAVSKLELEARIQAIQRDYTRSSPAFAGEFAQSAGRVLGGYSAVVDIIEKARKDAAKSSTSGDKWWQARAAEFGMDISDPNYKAEVQLRLKGKRAKEDRKRGVETGQWDQKAYLNTDEFASEANDDIAEYSQAMNAAVKRDATPVELDTLAASYEARMFAQHPAGLTSPKVTARINQIKAMRETFGKTVSGEFTANQRQNKVKAIMAAYQSGLLSDPKIAKFAAATKLFGDTLPELLYKSDGGAEFIAKLDSFRLAINSQDDGKKGTPKLMVDAIAEASKDKLSKEEFAFMEEGITTKLAGAKESLLTDPQRITELAEAFSDPRTYKDYWNTLASPKLKTDFRNTMTQGISQSLDTFTRYYDAGTMQLHANKDGSLYLSGGPKGTVGNLNNLLSGTVNMSRALANVDGNDYAAIGNELINQISQLSPVNRPTEDGVSQTTRRGAGRGGPTVEPVVEAAPKPTPEPVTEKPETKVTVVKNAEELQELTGGDFNEYVDYLATVPRKNRAKVTKIWNSLPENQ